MNFFNRIFGNKKNQSIEQEQTENMNPGIKLAVLIRFIQENEWVKATHWIQMNSDLKSEEIDELLSGTITLSDIKESDREITEAMKDALQLLRRSQHIDVGKAVSEILLSKIKPDEIPPQFEMQFRAFSKLTFEQQSIFMHLMQEAKDNVQALDLELNARPELKAAIDKAMQDVLMDIIGNNR